MPEQLLHDIVRTLHNLCAVPDERMASLVAPAEHVSRDGHDVTALFELAREAYERAVKLDPNNQYIQQNYELFREIHDRANRQSRR